MILFLCAAAAVVAPTVAAPPTKPATDAASRAAITAYIRKSAATWAKANVGPQPDLQVFLADDYRGVTSRGKIVRKADMAAGGTAKAADLYYANVRFPAPTVAIAQGEEWTDPAEGPRRHLIWTDTWLLRNGRWQVVASQDSAVPLDQPLQDREP